MDIFLLIIGWALIAWCGTGRGPLPRPEPNPGKRILFGILGGIAVGFFFYFAFTKGAPLELGPMALTGLGAYVGGFIVADLLYLGK